MSRQGMKRAALYATVLIVSLVLMAPYILDKIINSVEVKHRISTLIEQKTGVEMNPDQIDFLFWPQPGICFKDFDIDLNQMVQINIKAFTVDINIAKLIKGQFAVSKIFVDTPRINYTPLKNGQGPTDTSQPFYFTFPRQEIQKLFALFPDSQDTLELVLRNIQTHYSHAMDGSVFVSNTNQSVTLNTNIHGVHVQKNQFPDTSFLTKLGITELFSDKISVAVKLDETGKMTGNITVAAPRVLTEKIPERLLGGDLLDLGFVFSRDLLSIRLHPIALSFPRGKVGIDFIDDKPGKKSGITFIGDDIDIAQAGTVCLNLMDSNQVVRQLFDILRGGTGKAVTVGFSSNALSTLFDPEKLFLTGAAVDARVKIPETPLIAENVQGNAVLKKGVLYIQADKGQINKTTIKSGQLDIDLMNHEDVPFNGEFTLHSDLSTLPLELISLLPDTLLARELARVGQVSGQADGVLKLWMETMEKGLQVQVHAQISGAKGVYDRIPLPITITAADFLYETDKVTLKNCFGSLGDNTLENIFGVVDFQTSPTLDIHSGPARIHLDEIIPWATSYKAVSSLISPVKTLTGELMANSVQIQGLVFEPANWRFNINGSGRNIRIGFSSGKKKAVEAVSGRFTATEQAFHVQDLTAKINDASWLSYAIDLPRLASIKLPLNVSEANFENTKAVAVFQGQVSCPSGAKLSFDLTGKNILNLFPRLLLLKDADRTDAMIMLNKDTSKPLLTVEGKLNTETLENLLIKDSFLHERLVSFTMGNPINIFTDAALNLHVNIKKINLDSFKTKGPSPKKKSEFQPLFDQKILYLNSEHLTYKNRAFSNIETQIFFTPKKTRVQILNATLCNMAATGSVDLIHDTRDTQVLNDLTLLPQATEDIADLISCLFKNKNIIDGPYSFFCKLSGQAPSDMISAGQSGILTLNASNGRIYKWTFLSRLLSVLNILNFADITKQGIGYRTIAVEAEIKESVIHLKKAIVDADNMALIFSGWIDPLNDKMELTCLVAPFKTIDTLIKYIPVVNTMLSGRLISFPAKATGSMTDPVITALNPSAVGQGLVNTLEDILKTPVRLLEKMP